AAYRGCVGLLYGRGDRLIVEDLQPAAAEALDKPKAAGAADRFFLAHSTARMLSGIVPFLDPPASDAERMMADGDAHNGWRIERAPRQRNRGTAQSRDGMFVSYVTPLDAPTYDWPLLLEHRDEWGVGGPFTAVEVLANLDRIQANELGT